MNILDLLKGKKVEIMTEVRVPVELEIREVIEEHHSEELEPSTRENDWWPATRDWKTYTVKFTNGATKTYRSLNEIKLKS